MFDNLERVCRHTSHSRRKLARPLHTTNFIGLRLCFLTKYMCLCIFIVVGVSPTRALLQPSEPCLEGPRLRAIESLERTPRAARSKQARWPSPPCSTEGLGPPNVFHRPRLDNQAGLELTLASRGRHVATSRVNAPFALTIKHLFRGAHAICQTPVEDYK